MLLLKEGDSGGRLIFRNPGVGVRQGLQGYRLGEARERAYQNVGLWQIVTGVPVSDYEPGGLAEGLGDAPYEEQVEFWEEVPSDELWGLCLRSVMRHAGTTWAPGERGPVATITVQASKVAAETAATELGEWLEVSGVDCLRDTSVPLGHLALDFQPAPSFPFNLDSLTRAFKRPEAGELGFGRLVDPCSTELLRVHNVDDGEQAWDELMVDWPLHDADLEAKSQGAVIVAQRVIVAMEPVSG